MNGQTPVHFYLNWAKERIDELDAMLTSMESKARSADSASRAKVAQVISDMQGKRNEFSEFVNKQSSAGAAALAQARGQLDAQWRSCESEWTKLIEPLGQEADQQKATFQGLAEAQLAGWRNLLDGMQSAMSAATSERRSEAEAVLNKIKEDAASSDAQLKKMTAAGVESWRAFNTALAESRAAFDRANEAAQKAFSGSAK
jgi:uncharacterized phage infection (PIP) family protein YhgE